MRLCLAIGLAWALALGVWADTVPQVLIDGVTYYDVRWGPVNQGKVVFFHNHGVATVTLDKLPVEWQRKFGYDPSQAPAKPELSASRLAAPGESAYARMQYQLARQKSDALTGQDQALDSQRSTKAVLQGKLVDKSTLTELVGFLSGRAELTDRDKVVTRGYMLDLARLRESAKNTPDLMLMRPGLWEKTGEQVFLKEYQTDDLLGTLVRVYGQPIEDVKGLRAFTPGTEPTREQLPQLKK